MADRCSKKAYLGASQCTEKTVPTYRGRNKLTLYMSVCLSEQTLALRFNLMHKFSSVLSSGTVSILRLRNRLGSHRVRALAFFIKRLHFHPPTTTFRRFVARLAARAFLQSKITHDARLRAVAMALHDALKGVLIGRLFPEDFASPGGPGEMFRVSLSGWGGEVVRGISASNPFVLPEPSAGTGRCNHDG